MFLAYTFNVGDFFITDDKDEIIEDGSERLENIAKKLNFDYELLGFEQAAIVINRDIPNVLTLSEITDTFKSNAEKAKMISDKLKLEGVEVSEPSLVTEPDWDRYGECHNYV